MNTFENKDKMLIFLYSYEILRGFSIEEGRNCKFKTFNNCRPNDVFKLVLMFT